MAFVTRAQLSELGSRSALRKAAEHNRLDERVQASPSVFLSHSHLDKELVQPAVVLLANQGVLVYVDWLDGGMPDKTSPETAARIRRMIEANARFVMLGTRNGLESKWVPWELGIADGVKGVGKIAILAVRESPNDNLGSEYLGLYPTIQPTSDDSWGVFAPNKTEGPYLKSWLQG